jgi:hypothetical protein
MKAPAGSPVTSLSRRSRVPSAPINREANQPKVLQHTFSNLAKSFSLWLDSFGLNIDFTDYFYYLLVELKVFIENTLLIGAEGEVPGAPINRPV